MQPTLWLHAVSVGEVLAAGPLIDRLQTEHPQHRIVVSTGTASGRFLAERMVGSDKVFTLPFDLAFLMKRYLRTLQPELVLLMENEIWPNLIDQCQRHGIPVAVVNARIANDSRRRSRVLRPLWRQAFRGVTLFLAQSEQDASRILEIGADAGSVQITGNLKFDVEAPRNTPLVAALATHLPQEAALIVCGSTGEGEEAMLLNAWEKIAADLPNALLLAPRRADRFDRVADLVATRNHPVVRLSRWQLDPMPIAHGSVILLDTIGDLASLYQLARIAFVGGSLMPAGGHNPLEPARLGIPILMGNFYENVRETIAGLRAAGGIRIVSSDELPAALTEWLTQPDHAAAVGRQARNLCAAQSGATGRTVYALLPLIHSQNDLKDNRAL
jgi:3-deoxy-D-manno-octulosonic-acid transferase